MSVFDWTLVEPSTDRTWFSLPAEDSSSANKMRLRATMAAATTAQMRTSDDMAPIASAALVASVSPATDARGRLVAELREHALVIGKVTLSSGAEADYYVDAKRAILRPAGFAALGELVAAEASRLGATAVGGMTMGADAVACAALAGGAPVKAFFVRKDRKAHGLQRWVEGPPLDAGERCLVVEDVVTTGGSTIQAIERIREEGFEVVGVLSVLDRLAGGGEAIAEAASAPYAALATIDDVYPDRP